MLLHFDRLTIHLVGEQYDTDLGNVLAGWMSGSCVCLYVGPWVTFEIQLPQDDFNLMAWVLGSPVAASELPQLQQNYQLRGLQNHLQLLNGGWG